MSFYVKYVLSSNFCKHEYCFEKLALNKVLWPHKMIRSNIKGSKSISYKYKSSTEKSDILVQKCHFYKIVGLMSILSKLKDSS